MQGGTLEKEMYRRRESYDLSATSNSYIGPVSAHVSVYSVSRVNIFSVQKHVIFSIFLTQLTGTRQECAMLVTVFSFASYLALRFVGKIGKNILDSVRQDLSLLKYARFFSRI